MTDNIEITRLMNRGDWDHLNATLAGKPAHERRAIKREYKKRFLAGMDSEPREVAKVNAGRRAANLYALSMKERN